MHPLNFLALELTAADLGVPSWVLLETAVRCNPAPLPEGALTESERLQVEGDVQRYREWLISKQVSETKLEGLMARRRAEFEAFFLAAHEGSRPFRPVLPTTLKVTRP